MSVEQAKLSGIRVLDQPVDPSEKAEYVADMFNAIAPRYDLLNSILSGSLDRRWRRFAARCACISTGDSALDVCSGTGDFAHELRLLVGASGNVTATDFSPGMLQSGKEKFAADNVEVIQADAMDLPFPNCCYDAAVVGFGLRNVAVPAKALAEMSRVVKPLGRVVCLEFSHPQGVGVLDRVFKAAYALFSQIFMGTVGGMISGRSEAYVYLRESMTRWKTREEISRMMRDADLTDIRTIDLIFGLVCVHVGVKSASSSESDKLLSAPQDTAR
jgi:demethylmenaquinone methyltransferase/2-methoxy-6-polyprenyl-1,4-benzoquinol methylase